MLSQKLALAAAGNAAADPTYVDDVFQTYTFTGSGAARSINNGLDLSGEGGMVWLKDIEPGYGNQHQLFDTERGATNVIYPSSSVKQATSTQSLTAFNSNGFSLGTSASINGSGQDIVSWSFRKCAGFFDVVTWSGNSTAGRQIPHNLGGDVGMIMIKRLTAFDDTWVVYHRDVGNTSQLHLNTNSAQTSGYARWNSTSPTTTHFTVDGDGQVNATGSNYVAFVFGHNSQSFGDNSDQAIIKCGSYNGTGSTQYVNIGFEPQFVMIKKTNSTGNWLMLDTARGFTTVGELDHYMHANDDSSHSEHQYGGPIPGFGIWLEGSDGDSNGSGNSYVYMAIRRPHKPPTAGTEVFKATTADNTGFFANDFDVDLCITDSRNAGADVYWGSRLVGKDKLLESNKTDAETSSSNSFVFNKSRVFKQGILGSSSNPISWVFARKAKFCDIVTYTGNGNSASQVDHDLGVAPELIIVKQRDATRAWAVYATAIGTGKFLKLENAAVTTQSGIFDTAPTASNFTVGSNTYVNINNGKYIAYLFASLDGVSKIGKYTGTGSDVNVDCGFTNGARFILIKRITSGWSGNWWVFDNVRGITTGNEPGIYLNTNGAEYSRDSVAPLSSGFTVKPGDFELNASGAEFLFFAIA